MKSSSLVFQQIVDDVFQAITSLQVGAEYLGAWQWCDKFEYEPGSIERSLFTAMFVKHVPRCTVNANTNQILHVDRK